MDDVPGALKASAPLLDVLGGRKTHAWIRAAVWRLRVMARLRSSPDQGARSSALAAEAGRWSRAKGGHVK